MPISTVTDDRVNSVISQRLAAAQKLADSNRIPPIADGPYRGVEYKSGVPNDDETQLKNFAGNFTKGLKHSEKTGLVEDPSHYEKLVAALTSLKDDTAFPASEAGVAVIDSAYTKGLSADYRKLVNPLAGVAADVTGLDGPSMAIPPAPSLGSHQAAAEMVELYWMSELRDVPFMEMDNHDSFHNAVSELNQLNAQTDTPFAEFYVNGKVSRDISSSTVFRGSARGNDAGGYISQFLLKKVSFGTLDYEQKQKLLKTNDNYMSTREDWLEVQNGAATNRSRKVLEQGDTGRHIVTFRDLAHYVHFDALHQAYFNAALILGDSALSPVNPYNRSTNGLQEGFGTMAGPHVLVAVSEVATRALKAIWQQKWYVHRRLRPEAMGARVEYGQHDLIHDALLNSSALAQSAASNKQSKLLPMVFLEGSPMHPSYGAGHATVAGACVTILKAFFDTSQPIQSPKKVVLERGGGSSLVDDDSAWLSVGGELNKLAANIAIGRNGAGVHYRTDYTASMALGELVALTMLQEQAMFLREGAAHETAFFVERFDGSTIEIKYDGSTSVGPAIEQDTTPGGSSGIDLSEKRAGKLKESSLYAD